MKSSKLASGQEVRLLNISRGGVLLETEAPMTRGETICLRLVAVDTVFTLRGKILRSRAVLMRGTNLMYECAVALYGKFPLAIEEESVPFKEAPSKPAFAAEWPPANGIMKRIPGGNPGEETDDSSGILTVTVPIPQTGPDLRLMFGLNNW